METPRLNLLEEPLIRIRDMDGRLRRLCLPELLVELSRDTVRDYPTLRPHQRHPWHALLVQLAALALHGAGETQPWDDVVAWREALLGLTPEYSDGCAFCLVGPIERPAFLQPPVAESSLDGWKDIATPDVLDMLITSKNHDLKESRMRVVEPDDWLFALTSLQTQEGFLGAGNYGISRMNGGFSSRPALGILPSGGIGKRWCRDVAGLVEARDEVVLTQGLRADGGLALLWLPAWDGTRSIAFSTLDPFYIEVCRRIRLVDNNSQSGLRARGISTKAARIDSAVRKGVTGDSWIPVEEDKALSLSAGGFNYSLLTELAWGTKYRKTIAQTIRTEDGSAGISLVAQGIVRGQGKTEGYHERRVPLAKRAVAFLRSGQIDTPARISSERVQAIATMRGSILRYALFALFEAGAERIDFDRRTAKQQVEPFVQAFERAEDARFFDDLNREIECEDERACSEERLSWLVGLAERAEAVLRGAFVRGPQCGERRYRARARALAAFHGALRNEKHLPALSQYFRSRHVLEESA